jgi:hypothetical protein
VTRLRHVPLTIYTPRHTSLTAHHIQSLKKARDTCEAWSSGNAQTNTSAADDFKKYYDQVAVLEGKRLELDSTMLKYLRAARNYERVNGFRDGEESANPNRTPDTSAGKVAQLYDAMEIIRKDIYGDRSKGKPGLIQECKDEKDKLSKLPKPTDTSGSSTTSDPNDVSKLQKSIQAGRDAVQGVRDQRSIVFVDNAFKAIRTAMQKDDAFTTKFDSISKDDRTDLDLNLQAIRDQPNWRE